MAEKDAAGDDLRTGRLPGTGGNAGPRTGGDMGACLDKIQAASREILRDLGVRLSDPGAVALFAGAGVRTEGDVVFPDQDFLDETLASAPSTFTLDARNPLGAIRLGSGGRHYAPTHGSPAVVEADGTVRPTLLSDHLKLVKIAHASPLLAVNGGILAHPGDLPADLAAAGMVYSAALGSDKPLLLFPDKPERFEKILAMTAEAFGGTEVFRSAPRTLMLMNTLSPLRIDRTSLRCLRLCAEWGQGVVVTPGPMAGSTGPATLAGNMALAHAECLTALALSQLARPGTPAVYGVTATTCDLRDGSVSIGSPGYAVQTKITAAMARRLNLPCRSGGAATDAWEVSAQSGWEGMLSLLASAGNGVDLIIHAAGEMASFAAMSFEKLAMDLEMISMVEYYLGGVEVSPETLALETIKKVGRGGQYLTQRHTLRHARKEPWRPTAACRGRRDGESFPERLLRNAKTKVEILLDSYEPPELDPSAVRRMDEIMLSLGAGEDILKTVKATLLGGE
ncbi:MAG: trimethylamine methyltransferase family protein [Deltaproteobacteria bacterium]|nr:trimethylamine methyltransferase family protein [Deltaproteobacteria bacterium]